MRRFLALALLSCSCAQAVETDLAAVSQVALGPAQIGFAIEGCDEAQIDEIEQAMTIWNEALGDTRFIRGSDARIACAAGVADDPAQGGFVNAAGIVLNLDVLAEHPDVELRSIVLHELGHLVLDAAGADVDMSGHLPKGLMSWNSDRFYGWDCLDRTTAEAIGIAATCHW